MAEIDLFERSLAGAFMRLADDVPGRVDAAAVAHRVALEHPRRRARVPSWGRVAIPRPAWVLLLVAGLLAALVGGALLVGSQQRRLRAVVPPAATCPPGSTPDRPGPVDQARPVGLSDLAFDRRAGRLVALVGAETWTFDVCTNTWTQMHPSREPASSGWPQLVYDIDSDVTVGFGFGPDGPSPGRVWAYDLAADTWTQKRVAPTNAYYTAYDPVSGRVVAVDYHPTALWEYDVETDTWTPIRLAYGPGGYGPFAHDASVDRMVVYAEEPAGAETWLLDMRTATWSQSTAGTPVVEPSWAGPAIAYDESAERTLVMGSAGMAAYDAVADRWEFVAGPGDWYRGTTVYDPVNGRLVGFGAGAVVAFDLVTREWTVLLGPTE